MHFRFHIQMFICLVLTSCFRENASILEPLTVCDTYAQDIDVYGYCVYQNAHSLPDVESVDKYCSQAERWTEDCRQAWVMSQTNHPLKKLLQVCGSNAECSLELLDSRRLNDVLQQMKLCIDHTGPFSRDCVMHATQYWYFTWPTAEEIQKVAEHRHYYPDQVGLYIAARVACDGVGSCEGEQEVQIQCERYVRIFQNQNECPNQHRNRVWNGRRRTGGSRNQ